MKLIEQAKERIAPYYTPMEAVVLANQEKVLRAFHAAKVASHSFGEATGYGYADPGRETLEEVYRHVFKAEAALCRPQIVSGTHAISICLSILEPGDELVSASGPPYDTLQAVIGTRGSSPRSLVKRGISYRRFPCCPRAIWIWRPSGNRSPRKRRWPFSSVPGVTAGDPP